MIPRGHLLLRHNAPLRRRVAACSCVAHFSSPTAAAVARQMSSREALSEAEGIHRFVGNFHKDAKPEVDLSTSQVAELTQRQTLRQAVTSHLEPLDLPTFVPSCISPTPADLWKPLSELRKCSSCTKYFAHDRAMKRHESMCKRPFACETCGQKFQYKQALRNHERKHGVYAPFACETCGDTFVWQSSLQKHAEKNPGPHPGKARPRLMDARAIDMKRFVGMQPVTEQKMQHVTTHDVRSEIDRSSVLEPSRNSSMTLDGVLLHPEAPPGVHLGVLPTTAGGAFPINSFVPTRAEPGEMLARLLVPISILSSNFQLYLAAVGYENDKLKSTVRATILCIRSSDSKELEWAKANCKPLDITNNHLLQIDEKSSKWSVATGFAGSSSGNDADDFTHKLSVTLVLANGLHLSTTNTEWRRAFRVFNEFGKVMCPLCDVEASSYSGIIEHELRAHQEQRWPCVQCPKVYSSERGVRKHFVATHRGVKRRFTEKYLEEAQSEYLHCSTCSKTILWKSRFSHPCYRRDHGLPVVKCRWCSSEFSYQHQLEDHISQLGNKPHSKIERELVLAASDCDPKTSRFLRPRPVFKQAAYHTTSLDGQLAISSSLSIRSSKRTDYNRYESAFVHSSSAPPVSFARISSEPPPLIAEFPQHVEPGSETATCLFPMGALFPHLAEESEIRTDGDGVVTDRRLQDAVNASEKPEVRTDGVAVPSEGALSEEDSGSVSAFLGALNMSGGPMHNTTVHAHILVVPSSYLDGIGESDDEFALKHSLLPINLRRKNPIMYYEGSRWHVATRFRTSSSDALSGRPLVVTLVAVGDIRLDDVADRVEWRQSFTTDSFVTSGGKKMFRCPLSECGQAVPQEHRFLHMRKHQGLEDIEDGTSRNAANSLR